MKRKYTISKNILITNAIVIFIIFIGEIVALVKFYFVYRSKYDSIDFMTELLNFSTNKNDPKIYDAVTELEKIFPYHTDSNELGHSTENIVSILRMIITIVVLLSLVISHSYKSFYNKYGCIWCCDIITPFLCFLLLINHLYEACTAKYNVNLSDEELYVFDEEKNNNLRYYLDLFHKRKIGLLVCAILGIVGFILQCTLIITQYILDNNYQNKCNSNHINNNKNFIRPLSNESQNSNSNVQTVVQSSNLDV